MLLFVICDDHQVILENVETIIHRKMINRNEDYKVKRFQEYNDELQTIISMENALKLYILDIHMPKKSGFDIARQIREKDWDSSIIMLSAHQEHQRALKERLMLLDYISKTSDYETRIINTLDIFLKKLNEKKLLEIKDKNILIRILLDDIIYIMKNTVDRKTIIKTTFAEYSTNKPIKELLLQLNDCFFQTHRACVVNKKHIKHVDFKKLTIYFSNLESSYLLARDKKTDFKNFLEQKNVNV